MTSFKYLGIIVYDGGSKPGVLSRIAKVSHCSSDKAESNVGDNSILLGLTVKLMRSFFISIYLYDCESWTLTKGLGRGLFS